ncbi:ABC transporter permease [Actinoplanes sp. NPDC049802]|uniref:ABC transporter permease n=1 Tax=Actinoplanes sp. NPDC049802 TaxID=3154742 RepID=UPI0033D60115
MLLYILRRAASAISVIFVTLVASYALFLLAPTDPAGTICGPKCTPDRAAEITKALELEEPPLLQIGAYLKGVVAGRDYEIGGTVRECDAPCLGYSFALGRPVTELIGDALPVTLSIVGGAAIIYFGTGVLVGTLAARHRGTTLDRLAVSSSLTINSVPYFIVVLLVALYLSGVVIPRSEYHPLLENPLAWAAGLMAAWLTLGLTNAASYTRYSRAAMIESLGQDYVRTARSKGISERRVVYRHGVRAGLSPVVTIVGLDIAYQLTNTLFTESIFGLPGLGLLTLRAFNTYDLPVLLGSVLVGSTVLVLMNLLVDIIYSFLDPRVRIA